MYLEAKDVFLPSFLGKLKEVGLEVISPNDIKAPIFRFDKDGAPTAMRLRARTARAYKEWSGGFQMPLGGSGAELWLPIPAPEEPDPGGIRKVLVEKYKQKESGPQGMAGTSSVEKIYGSGWPEEISSVPDMGSSGPRGPQSGGDAQKSPAMPPQEDAALDENLSDKSSWPAHLDVEVKEAHKKLFYLAKWLEKRGFHKDSKKVFGLAL